MFSVFRHHRPKRPARQGAAALACLGLAALALAACQSAPPPGAAAGPAPRPVWLTDQKSISLLDNSVLAAGIDLRRQVEGRYKASTYYMDVAVQAGPDSFLLLAFNAFGTQLFELDYDREGVRYQTGLPVGAIKAEYLVADFQIALYPAAAVRGMLGAAGLRFEEGTAEGEPFRRVWDGERLIVDVRLGPGEWRYRNLLRDYEYIFR